MRIHHLNCGTMCPPGGRLMDGTSRGLWARLTCHCLLIETDDRGLVLVDTGFGTRDVRERTRRLARFFLTLNRPRLDPEETALRQVERLGFAARDVRHVVLTHLDFDHAGGLEDFPEATVHLLAAEREAASDRRGFIARARYRPQQWDEVRDWRRYAVGGGEPWFGFEAVRDLEGLPPEILLVPLAGHTRGHAAVAIRDEGTGGGGWRLHAGDAYFFRGEMDPNGYRCPPGLRAYQWMMEVDRRARLANQERLRALVRGHAGEVRVFCAHDPVEFETWAAANPAPVAGGTPAAARVSAEAGAE
ncbi:MAG TPA: MBL fold metallo-hydrolase [Geminicoccaceae bacterium]|nr:MBL fold metallo-hydrolase [Geminicoccaceae bacterium]